MNILFVLLVSTSVAAVTPLSYGTILRDLQQLERDHGGRTLDVTDVLQVRQTWPRNLTCHDEVSNTLG